MQRRRSWTAFGSFMLLCLGGIFVSQCFATSGSHPAQAATRPALLAHLAPQANRAATPTTSVRATAPKSAVPVVPATTASAECSSNPAGEQQLVVSISAQTLWACLGAQVVNTSPVTTGAAYDPTPTGTFYIQAKEGPQYLNGCDDSGCWHDYVHVWIPFDGPYGFHDAPWQTMAFGSPGYTTGGSHGCVHLPEAESAWVESWASVGTRVTILD